MRPSIASLTTACLILMAASMCVPEPARAEAWLNLFKSASELAPYTVENPTGIPTGRLTRNPATLQMDLPARTGSFYNGFDMAQQVNYDAMRLYRPVGDAPFQLITAVNTQSTSFTYLSGLYLYSADGDYSNDLVFGANTDSLKIDRGNGDWSISNWLGIGDYNWLLLKVAGDAAGNLDFHYKKKLSDSWSYYTSLSGFSFTDVGMITKTWGLGSYGESPETRANFYGLKYKSPDAVGIEADFAELAFEEEFGSFRAPASQVAIPEPSGIAMVFTAVLSLAVFGWCKRRASSS